MALALRGFDLTPADEHAAIRAAYLSAHNAREWDRMRTLLMDDLVFVDHRVGGFGAFRGADVLIEGMQVALQGAPDRQMTEIASAVDVPVQVATIQSTGTDDFGNPIEWEFLIVTQIRQGRLSRLEVFPVEGLNEAIRRASELSRPSDC